MDVELYQVGVKISRGEDANSPTRLVVQLQNQQSRDHDHGKTWQKAALEHVERRHSGGGWDFSEPGDPPDAGRTLELGDVRHGAVSAR